MIITTTASSPPITPPATAPAELPPSLLPVSGPIKTINKLLTVINSLSI